MTDLIGQRLGNYRLIRLLGQGGFAHVYLGEHVHLNTLAAIKILHTRVTDDAAERFSKEARMIAHLDHPNIVRVLEFGLENDTPFLVMDYAPNGTLRRRHPQGTKLSLALIVPYVQQLASALHYAHSHRVIHRDLKPENVLIGKRGEVLLSDFGLALSTQSSRQNSAQEIAGTIAYMAPEQLHGKPGAASDQYALGIVVYEWLCGERPFQGSFMEMYSQHMGTPPPALCDRLPELPPYVEQALLIALAKDPAHRYQSVQVFSNALIQAWQAMDRSSSDAPIPTPLSKARLIAGALTLPSLPSISGRAVPGAIASQPSMLNQFAPPAAQPDNHALAWTGGSGEQKPRPGKRTTRGGVVALVAALLLLALAGVLLLPRLDLPFAGLRNSTTPTAIISHAQTPQATQQHTDVTPCTRPNVTTDPAPPPGQFFVTITQPTATAQPADPSSFHFSTTVNLTTVPKGYTGPLPAVAAFYVTNSSGRYITGMRAYMNLTAHTPQTVDALWHSTEQLAPNGTYNLDVGVYPSDWSRTYGKLHKETVFTISDSTSATLKIPSVKFSKNGITLSISGNFQGSATFTSSVVAVSAQVRFWIYTPSPDSTSGLQLIAMPIKNILLQGRNTVSFACDTKGIIPTAGHIYKLQVAVYSAGGPTQSSDTNSQTVWATETNVEYGESQTISVTA